MICDIKTEERGERVLGIRRVLKKEKDIKASLEERKAWRVDPFQQGHNSIEHFLA